MNKIKPLNTVFLKTSYNVGTLILAVWGLTKNISFKPSINSVLFLLWSIILFSLDQIKGITQFKEKKQFRVFHRGSSWVILAVLLILHFNNLPLVILLLAANILVIWQTPSNPFLNWLAPQIAFWIFILVAAIYQFLGLITTVLLLKVILVFIAKNLFAFFLNERKFILYILLLICGILSWIITPESFCFYLLLQIMIPLIPRLIKKEEARQLTSFLYQIIAYWLV